MNKVHVVLGIFAALVVAAVNSRVTNQRDQVPKLYELLNRADPNQQHEFRIALKQKNIDILETTLLDASNPESKNYGKWWSTEKILDLIAPSDKQIHSVVTWLKSFGVPSIDASGRDFIKVSAPIRVIERLLKAEIFNFKSKETGKIVARVMGSVNVPDHLDDVIEMVTGLTEVVAGSDSTKNSKRANTKRGTQQGVDPLGSIYPGILRYMYDIPSQFPVHPNSSLGVTAFLDDESFNFGDVTSFNSEVDENVTVSTNNIVGNMDGASQNPTLGIQYGGAIALNTTIWFWGLNNNWLYEFVTQMFVAQNYPLVVSIARGLPEMNQCDYAQHCNGGIHPNRDYVYRINAEFVKLGLKGITILAASGNQGALGYDNKYCKKNLLSNQFPASSPWVTSVGATMLIHGRQPGRNFTLPQPPICLQVPCARTKLEGVCMPPDASISSGGGFSNFSSMPKWQRMAVTNYLRSGVPLPKGLFDPTKRAYPDVASNGHNYIFVEGSTTTGDGTEASTPVFAAIIALLNSVLLNNNKNPLGFVNPLLYKMAADDPTIFTDITSGNNYCTQLCCSNIGYVATKGWDPVTGLGTPVFSKMQAYIQKVLIDSK